MTTIRKITTSQIDGNGANTDDSNEIRPYGEMGLYIGDNNKLEFLISDGVRTHFKSKVLAKGTFYGGDADSADGNSYDTIKLIPDVGLVENGGSHQYIIVDPTAPNHVHIRAGGPIDNSNSELIIGGENSYVKIGNGSNPPVYVSSNDYDWTFNTDGTFVGPNGATIGSVGEGFPGFYNSGNNNPVVILNRNIDSGAEISAIILQPSITSANGGLATIWVAAPTGGNSYEYWHFKDTGLLELASSGLQFSDGTTQNTAATGLINDALSTSLIAGSGIMLDYDEMVDTLTISASGTGGISLEEVQDNFGESFLVSGTGISLDYNDIANTLTVNTSGLALSSHSHASSDITDFNSAVSGLIPVKDILSGTNISVTSVSGVYTVNSTVTSVEQAASVVTTVFNKTGSPIPKMTAVYINGGQGDMPTVALAVASGEMTSSKTYGITYEAISNMSTGKVIVIGALTGLNTDQFNPTAPTGDVNGTTLWLSPTVAGGLTTTKPSAPNHVVALGTIVRTHQNEGVIEVRIQNGYELEELHNVAISGVTNGQFLQYNSGTNLWVPSSSGNFTTLQVSGTNVSLAGHTHTSANITDFNSSVSGLLPVKNILAGSGISVSSASGDYTINSVTVVDSITFASSLNTDASAGDIFDITLTGNATLENPINPVDGKTLRWRIVQDGTGGHSVTLGGKFVIPSSATNPLPWSSSANAMDILAATYHAGRDKWDIVAFVPGY